MFRKLNSQKGNISLITLILFSMAAVTVLLPILQGSIVTFNNTLKANQRTVESTIATSALHYATKAMLMVGSELHQSHLNGNSFSISAFPLPVRVTYNFPQIHTTGSKSGIVNINVEVSDQNQQSKVVKSKTFEYVDMSVTAIYTQGRVSNLVAGEFKHVVSGGVSSWYVEEQPELIYENAPAFPIFKKDLAYYYSGDQTYRKWNYSAYRIAQHGKWVIPFEFNYNGNSYNNPQILEAENGFSVELHPKPNFKINNVNWVDYICRRIYLGNLYNDGYWGANFYLFTDPYNTNQPFVIDMPSSWEINIRYYPQINTSWRYPRFSRNFVDDKLHLNFAILYGSIISKTDIVCTVPFSTFVPLSGTPLTRNNPNAWMRSSNGNYWALLEQTGLWFCFTPNYKIDMERILEDYTINQGPGLLTRIIRN